MTRELLNTLFIQTPEAHASLKDDTVKVWTEDETILRVPLHHLGSICAFGVVHVSTPLMMRCAQDGRALVFFDDDGRFKARVTGKTGGNVLLRGAQWAASQDERRTLYLARSIVAGKVQNSRLTLLRAARDGAGPEVEEAIASLEAVLIALPSVVDLDELRGCEGIAAASYFSAFDAMISAPSVEFAFRSRSRRPPRNRTNALLSFVYAIFTSDCVGALEGVGLDPQLGFLHALRPGRPSLALDLVEEFRAVIVDRLVLTMINRRQITPEDFIDREGGACLLNDDGRKKVLAAIQKRKQDEARHALFKEKVPIGLLPHVQARLLARHLRSDIEEYVPYMPA